MIVDDLEFEELVEPVYRFRVMRCMNDALRNPEREFDLYFSSDSRKQALRVAAYENRNQFGDVYEVVDGSVA